MRYHETTASLSISEVYPEDEGEYLCLATNEAGSTQTTCEFRVQPGTKIICFLITHQFEVYK